MGFALWRSRAVPRWLAVLFTVGLEVAESMGAIGPAVVLYMLPFAAAMILLATRIWQAAAHPVPVTSPEAGNLDGDRARAREGLSVR
jgi:hypothetical protein